MTDTNTCATCDFYRQGNTPGHGTCHFNPPGTIAHSGFPIVAAIEWCAKGATAGKDWSKSQEINQFLAESLRAELTGNAERFVLIGRINELLQRNLWQRICNTVPWEGK